MQKQMDSSSSVGSVFLSFRGIDTRKNFLAHLYDALTGRGIVTFKDDETIVTGKPFPKEILRGIKNSSFAIIVISKNFASSKWCLIELESIMELQSMEKIIVIPIFYEVEPRELRREGSDFLKPFETHMYAPVAEKVPKWKEALKQVSNLQGKDSRKFKDDAKMIDNIVEEISKQLFSMFPLDFGDVVGIPSHTERLDSLMNIRSEKVRMIGIWGMGGIGKTTIAEYLFSRYSCLFAARCFFKDVGKINQNGSLVQLQEYLFSSILPKEDKNKFWSDKHGHQHLKYRFGHQKVFLVLDGVETVEQIQALAKETSMFGLGSRIIITTRDKSLLLSYGLMEEDLYEVQCLESNNSLLMFKKLAFEGGISPTDAHEQLSVRASQLAHGLPFAIKAFSSCFRGKENIAELEEVVRRLENTPHENTMEILRTSYKNLPSIDKPFFLHVACLFNGDSVYHATPFLDNFKSRIKVLSDSSLIKISPDGYIRMHVMVEQMGKWIVCQESTQIPHNQLLLWDHKDICKVLRYELGDGQIQCLALHMCEMEKKLSKDYVNSSSMHNLKFLKFYTHLDNRESKVQVDFRSASLELKLLHWDAYPLPTFGFDLQFKFLVELNLRYNNLSILWSGTQELENLRKLDVTGSKNLREIPDISKATKLEELLMAGCTRLERFPKHLSSLSNLVELNANNCDRLRSLHIRIGEIKDIQPCPKFILEFPNKVKLMQSLANLSIEGKINFGLKDIEGDADHFSFNSERKITPHLKSSFHDSKCLEIKRNNYNKDDAPFRFYNFFDLPLLRELNLINLKIEIIPSNIGELKSLQRLNLSGNDFKILPNTMQQLSNLKYLDLHNCCKFEALPQLTQVETVILSDCINLQSLLELSTLEENRNGYCLLELELANCNKVQSLSEQLSHFTNLRELDLSRHDFVLAPNSIRELSSLTTLTLNNCKKLKSLEELPLSLKCLYAHGCCLLENLCLSSDYSLEDVDLDHCFRLPNDIITRLSSNRHGVKVPPKRVCTQSISLPQIKLTQMVIFKALCFITLMTLSVSIVLPLFQ